jgi:hypothetical protein
MILFAIAMAGWTVAFVTPCDMEGSVVLLTSAWATLVSSRASLASWTIPEFVRCLSLSRDALPSADPETSLVVVTDRALHPGLLLQHFRGRVPAAREEGRAGHLH